MQLTTWKEIRKFGLLWANSTTITFQNFLKQTSLNFCHRLANLCSLFQQGNIFISGYLNHIFDIIGSYCTWIQDVLINNTGMFICFAKVVYVLKMSNTSKLKTVKFKTLLVLANSWNHKNLRPMKHFQIHQLLSITYFYNKNNTFLHHYILQLSQQIQEITKFVQCQIWVAQAFGKLPFQHLSYLTIMHILLLIRMLG